MLVLMVRRAAVALAFGVATFVTAAASAQVPPEAPARPRTPRPNMQAMNEALGVRCVYCHVPGTSQTEDIDFKSEANPKKRIARMMVAMTADINAAVPSAMLKAPGEVTAVTCATCHRGVPDPRPLPEIIWRTLEREGTDAAIAQYRDLRARFFGKDAYDFSDRAILTVAQRAVDYAPESALALLTMNLEFHPQSADSLVLMARAETRRLDDRAAIVLLERALAIDPRHALAQGFLLQLRQFVRPRP